MKFLLISLVLLFGACQQAKTKEQVKDNQSINKPKDQQDLTKEMTAKPLEFLTSPKITVNPSIQLTGVSLPTTLQPKQAAPRLNLKFQQATQIALPAQKQKQNQNKNMVRQLKQNFYCGRIEESPPVPPHDGVNREKLVKTIYGFAMYIDTRDTMVSFTIENTGTWEPDLINLIGHIVKPGHKVLNLGSQSGLEALVMGKIVGPTGKLYIFQPYSFSNQLVTKNIEFNGLTDITTIYKVGASDKKGTAIINIAYTNTGGSEIIPDFQKKQDRPKYGQYGQYSQTEQVQLDRVDALLLEDVSLDFALIDVQKMETKALTGMKKIIERSPNLVIMSQWQYGRNPRANKQQTVQLITFLYDKGYTAYAYYPTYLFCSVGSFSALAPEQLLRVDFMDVFFFPKGVPLPS